ncbi:MAG: lytic transglycosylase domain-containing protein [Burkholderiaceae bacterium]|jgi:soluble lytic murein transglycosylase|nr:lytic transglycosylase domain-containing protein [Burkholderiaceae bacterium]
MRFQTILTSRRAMAAVVLSIALTPLAWAQRPVDNVMLQMKQAFQRGDSATLTALLPQAIGNPLEAWAAYWELRLRLDTAGTDEINAFFTRYAGSYQEDRLRNDWLLQLGKNGSWDTFSTAYSAYRMRDDAEVDCYAVLADMAHGNSPTPEQTQQVRTNWLAQRVAGDGCLQATSQLLNAGLITADTVWRKARLATQANRLSLASDAISLVAPEMLAQFDQIRARGATRFLTTPPAGDTSQAAQEMVVLALLRIADADPDNAASMLQSTWSARLSDEQRNWLWGMIGQQSALKLSPLANSYFAKVTRNSDLSDGMLAWRVRTTLRSGNWKTVLPAIEAMSGGEQKKPTWTYWRARALAARGGADAMAQARTLYQSIAGTQGFYELLALDALGQSAVVPPPPEPLSSQERTAAAANPGLQRALTAIATGLRPEGVREWNYTTNLATKGGMSDRERLAAADLACQHQAWDRCINASERTKSLINFQQRYPTPFRDTVMSQARAIGLDPAYVYGFIRQESRFIMDAQSGVGASGLMQLMPATARWTARKIGLSDFSPAQINDPNTNIMLGSNFLKQALDRFNGSVPLTAAAYNAGPNRARAWRDAGTALEAAIWIENIPFRETRDYVRRVIANTTNYAALLTGQPQSITRYLGTVDPVLGPDPGADTGLP